MRKEAVTLESLSIAQAVKASGGKVILQVESIVESGSIDPRLVKIPGIYVDAIVISDPGNHMQTFGEHFNPAYCGDIRVPVDSLKPMELGVRKIISRRAALELQSHAVINLGIGIPEGIASVANEEGVKGLKLTVESGPIGGVPAGGKSFGAVANPECNSGPTIPVLTSMTAAVWIWPFLVWLSVMKTAILMSASLDLRLQAAAVYQYYTECKKSCFLQALFTAGGLDVAVEDGKLNIRQEARAASL